MGFPTYMKNDSHMIFKAFLRSLGFSTAPKDPPVTAAGVSAAIEVVMAYNLKVLQAVAEATELRLQNIETITVDLIHRVEELENRVQELATSTKENPTDSTELPGI